jgi:phthiocerol/phenolphthiocerol synthesis type-I polyketide synthase B
LDSISEQAIGKSVAIVGIGCRFPGGVTGATSLWNLLSAKTNAITEIPASRIDLGRYYDKRPATPGRMMTRWGGFIDGIEDFDAEFFGISPREAELLDPQQRLLLETAWEALEDAGQDVHKLKGHPVGVFVGQWLSDFESRLFADPEAVEFYMTTGSGRYAASGRLSYALGLRGPSLTLDTACSSSLVAIHLAVRSIRTGESQMAIAGGVNTILQPHISIAYSQSLMMAPDGRCKFGDASGDGYVRSEGAGLVLLKALDRALIDGDRIYAVIRGSAINNDGNSSGSIGTPSSIGQEELLRSAYRDAGLSAGDVGYVEAHGTGTRAGDPIELGALGAVLSEGRSKVPKAFVGSIKTNLGHTEGAAGIAGLIKSALALYHAEIPASLNCNELNPAIDWKHVPLEIARQAMSWTGKDRVAGVSAFGIAGSNAHVVLASAPTVSRTSLLPSTPSSIRDDAFLLPLSARSPGALRDLAKSYADLIASSEAHSLTDICATASMHRTPLEHRAALVAQSRTELVERLMDFASGEQNAAQALGRVSGSRSRKIVFVFPGQGGQWCGMARELFANEPTFRASIERTEQALATHVKWSLIDQLHREEGGRGFLLDDIAVIQPVLLAVEIALAELWRSRGIEPEAVVGHSMGEIGAAYIADVLSLDEALAIVCNRSALMRTTSGQGAMAVVELSMSEAEHLLSRHAGKASVAVSNGPRTSVISGEKATIDALVAELESNGVFARLVKVNVASHSQQMAPLVADLVQSLSGIHPRPANVPLYSTVEAARLEGEKFNAHYWGRNLRETVLFDQTVSAVIENGADTFIEMSPHTTLATAIHQTAQAAGREVLTLQSLQREEPEGQQMLIALGSLFAAGHPIDWLRIYPAGYSRVDLPFYPWQRQRYWPQNLPSVTAFPTQRDKQNREFSDWLYSADWLEAPISGNGTSARRWLLLAEKNLPSEAFATAFATKAAETGGRARVIYTDDGDLAEALEHARRDTEPWSGIVHCGALDATPVSAITEATLSGNPIPGVESLLEAIGSLDASAWRGEPKLWIVTRGATVVHDSDRLTLALAQTPMLGLARVVEAEQPTRYAGCVDLDAGATLAEQVELFQAELIRGGDEPAVSFRRRKRFVQRLMPVPPPSTDRHIDFRTDSSYLITGGLGGIGRFVARWLIVQGARHLVVFGRTPIPPRDKWRDLENAATSPVGMRVQAIRELEALGAAVHYFSVDVSDAQALTAVLESWQAEGRPPIKGIVHAAAEIEDQLLTQLEPQSIERVFGVKAIGAWLLDASLVEADWYIYFSSLASVWPVPGHANYAAANAFLDGLSQFGRGVGKRSFSVSWGLWSDVGVAATPGGREAQRRFADQGILGLPPHDGLRALEALLMTDVPHAVVLNTDKERFARGDSGLPVRRLLRGLLDRQVVAASESVEKTNAGKFPFVEQYRRADTAQQRSLLEACIGSHVSNVLKLRNVQLDPDRPLGEYGLNSIMGLELRHKLESDLSLRLSATMVWNYPTLAALTSYLQTRLDVSVAPASIPSEPAAGRDGAKDESPTSITKIGAVNIRLWEVEQLSDDAALHALRVSNRRDSDGR